MKTVQVEQVLVLIAIVAWKLLFVFLSQCSANPLIQPVNLQVTHLHPSLSIMLEIK
jgi:hypothetical protein